MSNLTITCGSIESININPSGFYATLKIRLNDVQAQSLLEQIDRDKIESHLSGLDQSTPDDEAAKDFEQLKENRENELKKAV